MLCEIDVLEEVKVGRDKLFYQQKIHEPSQRAIIAQNEAQTYAQTHRLASNFLSWWIILFIGMLNNDRLEFFRNGHAFLT